MRLSHILSTLFVAGALGACTPGADTPASSTSAANSTSGEQSGQAKTTSSLKKTFDPKAYFRDVAINARNDGDYQTAVFYWAKAYEADPKNTDVALLYARDLRYSGGTQVAIQVLKHASSISSSPRIKEEMGKALIAEGRLDEAITVLEQSASADPTNWRVYSSLGIARDQMQDYEGSKKAYERALALSPGNLAVLNNYALSRATAGDIEAAEQMISKAAAAPGANMQIRQNRVLILSMSGRFEEAQRIASADLPPAFAEQNIDIYREMLAEQDRWKRLQ